MSDSGSTLRITIDTRAFASPDTPLPKVWTVKQKIDAPRLQDIEGETRKAVGVWIGDQRLQPGATVAAGVGSRGIANLPRIVGAAIGELKARGFKPFIVPAMGSHGGATPEGQTAVLHSYGITEDKVGAPIRATMEVKQVAALDDGYPVFFDCNALGADAVVVINRVKPHTDFHSEIESGPGKMCAIGLGKQHGAATIHKFGADGLRNIMPKVARKLTETVSIVGAVAIIENPHGQTAEIHGLRGSEIAREAEMKLLGRARDLMPKLPFDKLDVLVIDEMGKNISGTGMDTNVIGRVDMPSIPAEKWNGPDIRVICCLDITDDSHGNASGIGLADLVTRRLIERTDFEATFLNSLTSSEGGLLRTRIPVVIEDANLCVRTAIARCGKGKPEDVRLAHVRNTEFVDTLEVTDALMDEVRKRQDLEVVGDAHPADFSKPMAHA